MIHWLGRAVTGAAVVICLALPLAVPLAAEDSAVTLGVGDTILTVSGRTSPGAFVTILSNGAIIGTETADSTGAFSHTFTAFPHGVSQVGVYAQDTQGLTTSPAYKEVNVAEHAHTFIDFFLPTSLAVDNPTVIVGTPIYIHGATIPGGNVVIVVDDATHATVRADANGMWQYTLQTAGMTPGGHTIYAVVNDPITAEQSYPTAKVPITLIAPDVLPPLPAPTPPVTRPSVPIITYPTNGSTIEDPQLIVRGRAEPGTRVELYNGSTLIGSTFTNSRGEWEIAMTLSDPSYTIRARACRLFVCSDFSAPVHFFWRSSGRLGAGMTIYLEQYWFLVGRGSSVDLNLHILGGVPPYAVDIDWGDGTVDHVSGKDLHQVLSHTYSRAGQFGGCVIVTDTEGAVAKKSFAVEVVVVFMDWFWLILLFILFIILLLLLLLKRRQQRQEKQKTKRHNRKSGIINT